MVDLGAHRVEHDIPGEFQQVAVLVHENRLESPLQYMPDPSVAAVEALGVDAVQLAHADGQVAVRRLDHQVVMVAHQAVGMA